MKNIVSVLLGFILGILANTVFKLFEPMTKSMWFLLAVVAIVIILMIVNHRQEQKNKLIALFEDFKSKNLTPIGLIGKVNCYANIPRYLVEFKTRFTPVQITKLYKWKRITLSELNIINDTIDVL